MRSLRNFVEQSMSINLNLLLDKLEETENNIKNDDNTNKINDFYDKYINSISFNNQYQKNL